MKLIEGMLVLLIVALSVWMYAVVTWAPDSVHYKTEHWRKATTIGELVNQLNCVDLGQCENI